MCDGYTIELHSHRFAVWAASRAAGRGVRGWETKVCQSWLEKAGLCPAVSSPINLPDSAELDGVHNEWCSAIIEESGKRLGLPISYGRAAKLVNVYLKCRFVCGGYEDHERVKALHPPVDHFLLKRVRAAKPELRRALRGYKHWTSFTSDDYLHVIGVLRGIRPSSPFWMVEYYWSGYDDDREVKLVAPTTIS